MEWTPTQGIDPQVLRDHNVGSADVQKAIRDIEAEALAEQAQLARDHPMPKEKPHRLRRWLHGA
jgi:hypothetical protein